MIILLPSSALEQSEGMAASLAELAKEPCFSFEVVPIEAPRPPNNGEEEIRLEQDHCVKLSFIEASGDGPAELIEATNKALRIAAHAKLDAIIAGSHVILDREAILELCAASEQDPMAGFVEASLTDEGNLLAPNEHRPGDRPSVPQGARIFEDLPRLNYVPVVEGPLVLIKSRVLQEFELLDCAFNSLASALNDLALRANRCGYRVVRAHDVRATATGRGKDEWALIERDEEILRARFPYLAEEIARYESSPDGKARKLLAGLRPDAKGRLSIVFACNNLVTIHNGTSELAKRIITEFSLNFLDKYNIHLLCSQEAFDFHEYRKLKGIVHLSDLSTVKRPFFASIRLVQPFGDEDIALLASEAPITMALILDTISIDCMQISPGLARVWESMLKSTSALGFISDFSRAQFDRRFPRKSPHFEFTALCSTDTKEYGLDEKAVTTRDDGYVLLVGNSYEHKFLEVTCDVFRRETPETKLVVLGLKLPDDEYIVSYESGQLNDEAAADLYARASLVLFPSHCEGFGLPIMHGLAWRKPIIARDLPVFREIGERIREAQNLHLFDTTVEMVRFAATKPAWNCRKVEPARPVQRWADMAKTIHDALAEADKMLTYSDLCDRLLEADACRKIAKLEAIRASQEIELAKMKLRWEPPVDDADMPGQAARFAAKRLESRIRRLLEWKWVYSLTRFAWGFVKNRQE